MNPPSDMRAIVLAKLPRLIRDAARDFRLLTGLTVVTTLGSALPDRPTRGRLSPPVHPRCAKLLRGLFLKGPCEAEWEKHLQGTLKAQGCRIHTCPLGLRCASVPILLGDELLALAKLVSGPEISPERFRSLVDLLGALIARPCQELNVILLKERIEILQGSVNRLRRAKQPPWQTGNDDDPPPADGQNNDGSLKAQTLIGQVLGYLSEHYTDSNLSLVQVAGAVRKNEKYVTHLFAQHVGERMRSYITVLRVRRACELLLQTSRTIEEIAHDSGFAGTTQFRRSFHSIIGVTATEYRQIFTSETKPRTAG